MHLEDGPFGPITVDGTGADTYGARVVIPREEFRRLELEAHEQPERLSPCLTWCVRRFGMAGEAWAFALPVDGAAVLYFSRLIDGLFFIDAWCLPEELELLAA